MFVYNLKQAEKRLSSVLETMASCTKCLPVTPIHQIMKSNSTGSMSSHHPWPQQLFFWLDEGKWAKNGAILWPLNKLTHHTVNSSQSWTSNSLVAHEQCGKGENSPPNGRRGHKFLCPQVSHAQAIPVNIITTTVAQLARAMDALTQAMTNAGCA